MKAKKKLKKPKKTKKTRVKKAVLLKKPAKKTVKKPVKEFLKKAVKESAKEVVKEEVKETGKEIGIFLCSCAEEISKTIDFKSLTNSLQSLKDAETAPLCHLLCQEKDLDFLTTTIEKDKFKKVIIGACSPQNISKVFEKAFREKNLSPDCFEIVNIREGCAWVHENDSSGALNKAKALFTSVLEKVRNSEIISTRKVLVESSAVVIGGGIAGIAASFELAEAGVKTYLLEKKPYIGGIAAKIGRVIPTDDCALCTAFLDSNNLEICRKCLYRSRIDTLENLTIITQAEVKKLNGSPGDFSVSYEALPRYVDTKKCILCKKCEDVCPVGDIKEFPYSTNSRKAIYLPSPQAIPRGYVVERELCPPECRKCEEICPTRAIDLSQAKEAKEIKAGAAIVATGMEMFDASPLKEYGFGRYANVINQVELARMLDPDGPTLGIPVIPSTGKPAKKIVMIQCVGSRDKYHEYCSEICCIFALKHANLIKDTTGAEVTICYIDLRSHGNFEKYYTEAREKWVNFIKGRPSEIAEDPLTKELYVSVEDSLLNQDLKVSADLVVLSSALIPSQGTCELSKVSNLNLNQYGFIKEYYGKNRSNETESIGVYVAGGSSGPKNIPVSIAHAGAAAAKAITAIKKQEALRKLKTAKVNDDLCIKCEICIKVCPVHAVEGVFADESPILLTKPPKVNELVCVNCGQCSAYCPTGAIQAKNYNRESLFAQIEGILKNNPISPKIVTFLCLECAYAAMDLVGLQRLNYPASILPIGIPCAGKVSMLDIFKSFELGADGVLVGGCQTCHFKNGKELMTTQVEFAKSIMEMIGIDKERLDFFITAIADNRKFLDKAKNMTERVKKLGS